MPSSHQFFCSPAPLTVCCIEFLLPIQRQSHCFPVRDTQTVRASRREATTNDCNACDTPHPLPHSMSHSLSVQRPAPPPTRPHRCPSRLHSSQQHTHSLRPPLQSNATHDPLNPFGPFARSTAPAARCTPSSDATATTTTCISINRPSLSCALTRRLREGNT